MMNAEDEMDAVVERARRATDHDPLAEALMDGRITALSLSSRPAALVAADLRAALDAAGYEVRPKLTAERLCANCWHRHVNHDDTRCWVRVYGKRKSGRCLCRGWREAVEPDILAALDAAP